MKEETSTKLDKMKDTKWEYGTLLISEVRGQRSRSQLTRMEISCESNTDETDLCFLIKLGRHFDHGKPYWFWRSHFKGEVHDVYRFIDKFAVRGDATLCVVVSYLSVCCRLLSYRRRQQWYSGLLSKGGGAEIGSGSRNYEFYTGYLIGNMIDNYDIITDISDVNP